MLAVASINFNPKNTNNQNISQNRAVSFARRGVMPDPPEVKKIYEEVVKEAIPNSTPPKFPELNIAARKVAALFVNVGFSKQGAVAFVSEKLSQGGFKLIDLRKTAQELQRLSKISTDKHLTAEFTNLKKTSKKTTSTNLQT